MMALMGSLGSTELIIILIIILLVFGSTKLPKLARSLGQAQKEFKSGMTDAEREESEEKARAVEAKAELNRSETDLHRSEAERAEARKDSPSS
jgi:sec-independent protein translocase protein TatA